MYGVLGLKCFKCLTILYKSVIVRNVMNANGEVRELV